MRSLTTDLFFGGGPFGVSLRPDGGGDCAVHLLQVGLLLRDQASSQPPAAACVCTYAPRAIYVRASSMALRLDGESELLLDLACTLWS